MIEFGPKVQLMLTHYPEVGIKPSFISMLKWEGFFFIILILLLSSSIILLFYKDHKKTKALQAFFASLTHELKTPLASIRLQADVIRDVIEKNQNPKLERLSYRMIEDTKNLEIQMDKILQLSRIEQGGDVNVSPVKIDSFSKMIAKKWQHKLDITIKSQDESTRVLADEFALTLILKNLFENTCNHTEKNKVTINISHFEDTCIVSYYDGAVFKGDVDKLGKLFYKFNSTKGSGIGLYLIKKLMKRMKGHLEIINDNTLVFNLHFQQFQEESI